MKIFFLNEKGFTLIEALIATAILSIGILSLYTMTLTTIRGNANAQGITEASNVLTDQMEQLLALSYDDSQLSTSTQPPVTTGLPRSVSKLEWTVTQWSNDGVDNDNADGDNDPSTGADEYSERGMKSIVLTVTYTTLGIQKTQTIQFEKAEIFL